MKNFDVIGVPNSISPNKFCNFIAVGYFDENIITLHNYDTFALTGKIKINYCSAYNNLIKSNGDYFVFLDEAKKIKILNSKTLENISEFNLDEYGNFGSINSMDLLGSHLYVFANSPIGSKENKKDIFIIDLSDNTVLALDSGIYVKQGKTINDTGFVVYGNYLKESNVSCSVIKVYDSNNQETESYSIQADKAITEVVLLECDNKKLIRSFVGFENEENNIMLNLDHVVFGFDIKEFDKNIVAGYYSGLIDNLNAIYVSYDSIGKKYAISIKKGNSFMDENLTLPFDAVTGASSSSDDYFYFGADKKIAMVELGNL